MYRFPYLDILDTPYPNEEIEQDFPEKVLYAAQFAPFSALTGHDEQVEETARYTEEAILLDESQQVLLNRKFCYLNEKISQTPEISVTYFVKDSRKNGGTYHTKTGKLIKFFQKESALLLSDGTKIPLKCIIAIESPLFDNIESISDC